MKWPCYLAIACSALAIGISICTWQQADARADAALRRREKALFEKYQPAVERICKDFDIPGPSNDSQTLDALIEPLGNVVSQLSK